MYKLIGADNQEYGPVSAEQLRQWVAEGRVNGQTRLLKDGESEWKPMGSFLEFASLIPPAPGQAAPTSIPSLPSSVPSTVPPGQKIPNYLVQSILVTLCCCLPAGVAAIVYAAQVNSKQAAGDLAGALESSNKAKMWCWISLGVGIVFNIIIAVVQFMAAAGNNMFGR